MARPEELPPAAAEGKPKRTLRAPVRYSEALADEIIDRVEAGEALAEICRDTHMPDERAVRKWADNEALDFGPRYARARDKRADLYAEEIISISDAVAGCRDGAIVAAARLRVDSRKWIASKLLPKRYGDRMTVEGNPDAPLQTVTRIELVAVAPSSPVDLDKLPVIEALPKGDKSS